MINIRIFYEKRGRTKYTSHLDMNRLFQRALKRSGLPVWYSEGFNPHIYLTFAMPLSLGYESECESVDLRLVEDLEFPVVMDRLNACLPEGVRVNRITLQDKKPAEIEISLYQITLNAKETPDWLKAKFLEFMDQDQILVEKKSKKGILTVDILPDCQVESLEILGEDLILKLILPAGIFKNINPTLLIEAFTKYANSTDFFAGVLRLEVYCIGGEMF